eukprot:CAMPEP_0119568254 /NCGR_PEP_ID=MMETSP1352-20130426/38387_1 /TAXON_ID=265584 /ORGANISM="Stauroneis constricta, Strain CCMP1120" /LENGTH=204 /DNA_ID=CAMNT_0007617621 /DNA_START=29 /DNA_END=640 /DNA_ORIENTATION=+
MTIVAKEDNRNLEWRNNNVGANLLQKMGWNEGDGLGKRSKSKTYALRAIKRQDGLGVGAKITSEGGSSESSKNFSSVLAALQAHHDTPSSPNADSGDDRDSDDDDNNDNNNDNSKSEKKKKSKKSKRKKKKRKAEDGDLILAQNKVTAGYAKRMRDAKFGSKSAEDMACIFGNKDHQVVAIPATDGKKKSKKKSKKSKKEKKSD